MILYVSSCELHGFLMTCCIVLKLSCTLCMYKLVVSKINKYGQNNNLGIALLASFYEDGFKRDTQRQF